MKIKSFISSFKNNKKVVENYIFMTLLQVSNSLFYIIIYPYLIGTLGPESYGLFVYILAIVMYFTYLINFGFDLPATRAVVQNKLSKRKLQVIVARIVTAKLYLQIVALVLFIILLCFIPFFKNNSILFICIYIQTFSYIMTPSWYYAGLQKMKRLTLIQISFKLLSLPFIFYLVKKPEDVNIFALLNSVTILLAGVTSFLAIVLIDKIKVRLINLFKLKDLFKEAFPFFISGSFGVIKEQGIVIIIGAFFGMRDVAIYDLANKVIVIPRALMANVNAALFPKFLENIDRKTIKKILSYEFIIGLVIMIFITIFGKWVIIFLGGESMQESYYIAIILSTTIISWLVVGAFINFVLIPNNKYYWITQNQFIALTSLLLFILIGFAIDINIFVLVGAVAFSGFAEIAFCYYKTKKYKLL